MSNIERFDNTAHKRLRRMTVREMIARYGEMLGTDYPGPFGRKFIREQHQLRPDCPITLVNKLSFKKDYPDDTLEGVVEKIPRKNIFDVIQYHPAKFVDIDLFGGLSDKMVIAIEIAPYWKAILLTFSNVWRSKDKTAHSALAPKEDAGTFMELWAKRNRWHAIMTQRPYTRHNKLVMMGIPDERGPKYYTYFIER